jgi:hypothetical protein
MSESTRRRWLGGAALTAAVAAAGGATQAQTRSAADELVRAVKGARVFDLSFTWNDRSPVLGLNRRIRSRWTARTA